ncbi:MAG: hypothetical protein AAF438_12125 [Pseudomonadota bacterium]
MLECVIAVTFLVQDLRVTVEAYGEYLGYTLIEKSTVSPAMAETWNTPAMTGRPFVTLKPESGASFFLRFIQGDPVEGYAPLTTDGWNATELLTQDPDHMVEVLQGSPFEIIGHPYDLSSDGSVRAMQVKGPSGEILYLTRIKGERTSVYGAAQSLVDRAFILVVGSRDYDALIKFYGETLGHKIRRFGKTKITVLSKALGLDPESTLYELRLAELGNQFNLELDHYPIQMKPRPRRDGELPPGMSMVSFGVTDINGMGLDFDRPIKQLNGGIYQGADVVVAVGTSGEWMEFVQKSCE